MKIILASSSPRRKKILESIGTKFNVIKPVFDESSISYNKNPKEYCKTLAIKKAESIMNDTPNSIIISADTIVICKSKLLNKPENKKDAFRMLNLLSGIKHEVYTGVAIANSTENKVISLFHEKTEVEFKKLNQNIINYYIKNYKPYDKAGSYGIQEFSSLFVKKINGCYFNVIGLPISALYDEIKKLNLEHFILKSL
tara:strand:- start:561 stop:1154 length:594 start_codon:yes stop_codon:yes gene_type:complete